jgi:hypothetical protein
MYVFRKVGDETLYTLPPKDLYLIVAFSMAAQQNIAIGLPGAADGISRPVATS